MAAIKLLISGFENTGKSTTASKIEDAMVINFDRKEYGFAVPHMNITEYTGIDGLIDGIGGNGGSGLTEPTLPEPDMDDSFAEPETSLDDMAMDDNEPASAGPEDEPLGRAPVEL